MGGIVIRGPPGETPRLYGRRDACHYGSAGSWFGRADDGGAVIAEAGDLVGGGRLRHDFQQTIAFAGRLRQKQSFQGRTERQLFVTLLAGGLVFFAEPGNVRNNHVLGTLTLDPVAAAFAFGRSAKNGFGEGQFKFATGSLQQHRCAPAGFDLHIVLDNSVAHDRDYKAKIRSSKSEIRKKSERGFNHG